MASAWSPLERLRSNGGWFAARAVPLGLLFAAVYGGAAWHASRGASIGLALPWERAVPFMALAFWPYASIFLVFWLPLALLERAALAWLMHRYVLVTLLAGLAFLAVPTHVSLSRPEAGAVPAGYALLYSVDGPFNAAPSLHVAYTTLILATCARALGPGGRAGLVVWWLLIAVSAWLTHQHQLADIAAGALLGGLSASGSGSGAGSSTGRIPTRHIRRYWAR